MRRQMVATVYNNLINMGALMQFLVNDLNDRRHGAYTKKKKSRLKRIFFLITGYDSLELSFSRQ